MNSMLKPLSEFSAVAVAAVLNSLWLAVVVALIVRFVLRFAPRVNAATRHVIWWSVLAVVALMPLTARMRTPASPVPAAFNQPQPARAEAPPADASTHAGALPSAARDAATSPAFHATTSPASAPIPVSQVSRYFAFPLHRIELRAGPWLVWLLAAWMAACLALLARVTLSYLYVRRLRRQGRPATGDLAARFAQHVRDSGVARKPELLVSSEISSPLSAGFLRPVVVIPAGLIEEIEAAELDYVLLHELAHVARRDDWSNLAARLASAVFVLHPVALWVLRQIEREREIACDDWVVAAAGSARRYAATLARMFEVCRAPRREWLATGMAERASHLAARIERLLRPSAQFSSRASLLRVFASLAVAVALLSACAHVPGWIAFAQESETTPPPAPPMAPLPPVTPVIAGMEVDIPAIPALPAMPALPAQSAPHVQDAPGAPAMPAVPPAPAMPGALMPALPTLPAIPTMPTFATIPGAPTVPVVPGAGRSQGFSWAGATSEWKLERISASGKVRFTVHRQKDGNNWTSNRDTALSNFRGLSPAALDKNGDISFEYIGTAGKLVCKGRVSGGKASGTFTVEADPEFVAALRKLGYDAPTDDQIFDLIFSNVTLDFARSIHDTGLPPTIEGLVVLANYRVPAAYVGEVRNAGYQNFTASDIAVLRSYHVRAELLKELKAQHFEFSAHEIAQLAAYHVEASYIRAVREAGYKDFSVADLTQLSSYHVSPELLKGLKQQGYDFPVHDIVQLASYHVDASYIRTVRDAGYKDFSAADLTQLASYHVSPDLLKGLKQEGYDFPVRDIVQLASYHVDSGYIRAVRDAGYKDLNAADLTQLSSYHVNPELLKALKSQGYDLPVKDVVQLGAYGVTGSYMTGLKTAGLDKLPVRDIVKLKSYGVTPEYVKATRDLGYQFTTDDLIKLHSYGINQAYLQRLNDSGMKKKMTADEILKLRGRI